ncbi:VOC family protein [Corynebacterium sp. zg-331]|uniref:VOC family protein n=1 Tax=unclassified Corynebacterium TaxID=2624378 RepID=UPI00128E0263|nr:MULTISPECIES: VOC family protein [unclassified Corynebacterium]MBC3186647.1 VOC family protein [Corynebacterium sp. zg-331]MPV53131.1 VOC family protein [Corynebacterium sp. zg331]
MPAFHAEPGMPYWIDLNTSDPRRSQHFYSELLGWEFEQVSEDGQLRARVQGLPVAGLLPQPEDSALPDTWVTSFAARDLDEQMGDVERLGGRVLSEPQPTQAGRLVVLADATGALFGLVEPPRGEAFVAAGEPGTPVWHELTATARYAQAGEFYRRLLGWTLEEGQGYTTALADGAAFAGLADAQGQFPPQVPSFWQSYLGVEDVDAAVARVPELGGQVIRPGWESPFGRLAIIADSTGATVMLCQVAAYTEPDIAEGDDIFAAAEEQLGKI